MLTFLVLYALTAYFAYHLASRAEILSRPRAWVVATFPGWLTYPLGCAFCFTFHLSWVLGLVGLPLGVATLCAAPVLNMVLDLIVRALIRANEPPVIQPAPGFATGGVVVAKAGEQLRAGELVKVNLDPLNSGWGWMTPPPPQWQGPLPAGWTTWTTGDGPYATAFACTLLHGRRVRTTYFDGQTGTVVSGFRNGDDCSGTWGELMYRLRWDAGQTKDPFGDVPVKSCTFLDEPFNPLAHEQTK